MMDWGKLIFPGRKTPSDYVAEGILDLLRGDHDSDAERVHNEQIALETRAQEVRHKMELLQNSMAMLKESIEEKKKEIEEGKREMTEVFVNRLQYVLEIPSAKHLTTVDKAYKNPQLYIDYLSKFRNDVEAEITQKNALLINADYEEIEDVQKKLESLYSKRKENG